MVPHDLVGPEASGPHGLLTYVSVLFCLPWRPIPACAKRSNKVAPPQAPVVPCSLPISREVTDYVDFTGRTDAVESVDIRPRVTGYLVQMPFREGDEVKSGDLLFVVDPRPYQAQLDQAEGLVKLYQAQLDLSKTTYARDVNISKTPGAVSLQQLDQDRAAVGEAEAQVGRLSRRASRSTS